MELRCESRCEILTFRILNERDYREQISDSDDQSEFVDKESISEESDEDEDDGPKPSQFKRKQQSGQKQRGKREEAKNTKNDDFGVKDDIPQIPPMQRLESNTSDLFADSPVNRGTKRMREDDDDVFNDSGYKRFKDN